MIFIIMMAIFFVYWLISTGVVLLVATWAKKKGRRPFRWGLGAALVMYHLVFWDFIPTYVVYKYYCATKAGFWVYKTPEQWKAENPGVAETLTWSKNTVRDYYISGITSGYYLNDRIVWTNKVTDIPYLPVAFTERLIKDLKNNEILIKQVSVGAGDAGTEFTRFWTHIDSYTPNNYEFNSCKDKFRKLGSEVQ